MAHVVRVVSTVDEEDTMVSWGIVRNNGHWKI